MRLQCPKTKVWNIRGKVKGVRYSESGTIVSYDFELMNGNITTRHRRFMSKELPEVESQPDINIEQSEGHQDLLNMKSYMRVQISLLQ